MVTTRISSETARARDAAARLRVVVNDRPLRQTLTGVGHYIRELLLHLPLADPDLQADPFFFRYFSRQDWRVVPEERAGEVSPSRGLGEVDNGKAEQRERGGRAAAGARLAESRKPWWVRRLMQNTYAAAFRGLTRKYALYHEPNHIPMRSPLPTVTTVHDLSVLAHPEWHPADRVKWYENEFSAGVRQTRRFIAASEYTKSEMVRLLGLAAERIDVTYQAPRDAFAPALPQERDEVLTRLALPQSFFLYVGTLEPRKNLPGLLRAFAGLPAAVRQRHPLVLVGAWGWKIGELQAALRDALRPGEVLLLGYLHDRTLAKLYTACTALVWPTFYEGFGMPPLEAMACGAPVIVSRATSLPEVVGDAGVLLDPGDEAAWSAAMLRAASEPEWRREARERSLARAAEFSWRRCAEQTVACYRRALGG